MDATAPQPTLGAILAGGPSRRFGSPKALALLDGEPLIRHVARALGEAVDTAVVFTASGEIAAAAGLEHRADVFPGAGPLGGLHAALVWAAERAAPGVLVVGCDTPFLPAPLLRALAQAASSSAETALAAEGAAGPEPLCAWYSVRAAPEVESRLRCGDRSLQRLLDAVSASTFPLEEVRRYADPERCFLNLNTRDELSRAEGMHGEP